MPVPNWAPAAPIVDEVLPRPPLSAMTKILRMIKRHRRARSRWTPKRLELGAIPA
jgi:hypothetical protein